MRDYLNTLLVLIIAAVIIMILLLLLTPAPLKTLENFVFGPFANIYNLGNMLSIAAVLIICGTGMTISFQAGLFNLGGEGQIYLAGTVGALLGLILPADLGYIGSLIMIIAGAAAGGATAAVSGVLSHRYRIHELISSFLLSGAIVFFIDFLIAAPLRDPEGFLQSTRKIPEQFYLPSILEPSNLSAAIFIAVFSAISIALWLYKTPGGYELRVFGTNPSFADFGGISRQRYTILPLAVSGACYGLAGTLMVLSTQHAAIVGFSSGYGWNGIVIALIAGNNPLMTIPAALLLAWIETGIRTAMSGTSLSFELSTVIRGIILLLITLHLSAGRRSPT